MALASMMKWDLHQMDVKTAFLNGVIEFEDRWTHVCKWKKALYGMKKTPRAWYGRIDSFLMKVDPNLYFKVIEDEHVILLLYVDNLFLTRNEK